MSVATVNSITINNQTLNAWQNGPVTLSDNSTANVIWSGDGLGGIQIQVMIQP